MKRPLTVLATLFAVSAVAGCSDDASPAAGGSSPSAEATSASTALSPSASRSIAPSSTTSPTPSEPGQPKLGQKQATELGDVTVYSVDFPVRAQDRVANDIHTKGMRFAVVDIKVCSNGAVNADGYGFDVSDFEVVDKQSRAYSFWNKQVGARLPNLTDVVSAIDTPRKGACKRGWLTFELPPTARTSSIEYSPYDGTPLVWTVR